jgi:hypothetical protein
MRKASISVAVITSLVLVASVTGAGNAGAQQPDHCLNNSGAYTVDAGFQYTDANGTWVCAPGSVSASAGGWIRLETPAINSVPATVTTNTNPTINDNNKGDAGSGVPTLTPLLALIAIGIVIGGGIIAVIIVRLRSAPRLTGTVKLEEVRRGQR